MSTVQSARGAGACVTFATVVPMWAAAYIFLYPGLDLSPWLVAIAAAVVMFLGGIVAGRVGGVKLGACVGIATAVINLLVLASQLGASDKTQAAMLMASCSVITIVLMTIGSLLGQRHAVDYTRSEVSWTARLALVTAATTLLMLLAGGIVTGLEAGLAVRGWLTSNDYLMILFPLEEMRQDAGTYTEHSHRLLGLLVGLVTIVLTVHVWTTPTKVWLRILCTVILLAVIVQGVLGGFRVTEQSIVLAIMHGALAQFVFAAMVLVATCTGSRFSSAGPAVAPEHASRKRFLSGKLVLLLLAQVVLGAMFRHLNGREDVSNGWIHGSLGLHIVLALAIMLVAVLVGGMASREEEFPLLRKIGNKLVMVVAAQIVLGTAAVMFVLTRSGESIPMLEILFTTVHHTVGALLLATSVAIAVWNRRVFPRGG